LCADPNMGLASTQAQHRHRFLQRPCSGLLQSVALCVRSMQPVRACNTWACSVQQLKWPRCDCLCDCLLLSVSHSPRHPLCRHGCRTCDAHAAAWTAAAACAAGACCSSSSRGG
jgi:hypothetical protein